MSETSETLEFTPLDPNRPRTEKVKLEFLKEEEGIEQAWRSRCEEDFLCFIRGIRIASQTGPRLFESCMAYFQREVFEDIAASMQALRKGDLPPRQRWWLERTKKAAKDADLALMVIWQMAFPIRPFSAEIGAADREQAGIIKERITAILHINPWLNDYVELVQNEIRSKRKNASGKPLAYCSIRSSDVAGAHGRTPDLLIINELSHITKWEFVENLMDNADGVAQGIVLIGTNAGYKGTKAEMLRISCMASDFWEIRTFTSPAPWHSRATIVDAKSRNTRSRFLRLWKGVWVRGKGDALDEDDIHACFTLDGPTEPETGWMYVAGLDLGITHDHSALCVLGVNFEQQRLKLVWWKAWEPAILVNGKKEVDLQSVEDTCFAMTRHYNIQILMYDPHQCKFMAQRLNRRHIRMKQMTFSSGTNLTMMATSLIQVVEEHRIECYDDADGRLKEDFGKFNVVEKPYGYKLEAVSDETGHADVGVALTIILPAAVDMLSGIQGIDEGEVLIADPDVKDIKPEEYDQLDPEMRDIYEAYDEIDNDNRYRHRKMFRGSFEDEDD